MIGEALLRSDLGYHPATPGVSDVGLKQFSGRNFRRSAYREDESHPLIVGRSTEWATTDLPNRLTSD
jgi:hypothetical protein